MSKFKDGEGLQHAKSWVIELSRCKHLKPLQKLTGAVIREHFHTNTGTVYIGSERLAELMGVKHRGTVSERRKALIDYGWLTDTGASRGRTPVFALTIPACGCGNHQTPATAEVDGGLTPEEQAEILSEHLAELEA